MKRILVPVDGSPGAVAAARFAAKIAAATGATIELLFVHEAATPVIMGLRAVDDIERVEHRVAQGSLSPAVIAIRDEVGRAVQIEEHVALGHPEKEIVAYAKLKGHDMICMGSRGRSEVAELVLGSVGQYVSHHATCPVLLVR